MEMIESNGFKVLIFPWLAHGHISPYFELARKLSKRTFHIYFCSTAINLSSIEKSFNENLCNCSIEFVELHLPNFPELPPEYHTTKGLPPNLYPALMSAFQMAKPSFSNIIKILNPDLLIYDCFQPWAAELASLHDIPSVHFYITSATSLASLQSHLSLGAAAGDLEAGGNLAFQSFKLSNAVLIKSCSEMEKRHLDYLSSLGKKMVTLGPLVQESNHDEEDNDSEIITWLNKKGQSSVVLVSFGSEYFLSKDLRHEIANALEQSNVNFIWVIRFPSGNSISSIEEALPEGFLERVKERGKVVDGWAPQVKILGHSSLGGFVSHCGWNSIMESLYYGVPLIAMPMHLEQPLNARLVVEIGVGMEVLKNENGQLKSEEIARVIKEVVFEKTGEELRENAKLLRKKLRMKKEQEIDEAVEELWNICSKNAKQQQSAPTGPII